MSDRAVQDQSASAGARPGILDDLLTLWAEQPTEAIRDFVIRIRTAHYQAVQTAFYDGFRVGIVREPWADCYDWAAVVGVDYAKSGELPTIRETAREPK